MKIEWRCDNNKGKPCRHLCFRQEKLWRCDKYGMIKGDTLCFDECIIAGINKKANSLFADVYKAAGENQAVLDALERLECFLETGVDALPKREKV